MPVEFYIIIGVSIAVMAFSAFYLGDENKNTRRLARVGIVLGGTSLFVATLFYAAIFAAVLVVVLPIVVIVAWWNGAF